MKRKLEKAIKRRRGVTLAETVIAIAAVTIISAAAVTLMTTSFAAERKMSIRDRAINDVENAYECCRFAENISELHALWLTYMDGECRGGEHVNELVIERSDYTVKVTWDIHNVEILASDTDGDEIYKLNYEKN